MSIIYNKEEQIKYWTPILEDLCQHFPLFDKYIQDPLSKIYTWEYEYCYRNRFKDVKPPFVLDERPVNREDIWTEEMEDYIRETWDACMVHGSYRACLIFDGGIGNNWVLKFSISLDDDNSDEENDCCEVEELMYENACKYGVEEFFAENHCIGSIAVNGHSTCDLYVARRYDIDAIYCDECSSYHREFERNHDYFEDFADCFCDEGIGEAFVLAYDYESLMELQRFICDFNICDLHDANIGFTEEREPVIIDYSLT